MRVGELKGYTDDELRIASEFDESGPEGVRIWRRLWECVNARNVEMGTEEDQLLLKQWRDALKALRRLEHEAARDPVTGEVTSIARMLLRPEGGWLVVPEGVYDYAKRLWKRVSPQMGVAHVDDVLLVSDFLANRMVTQTDEQHEAWLTQHPRWAPLLPPPLGTVSSSR